MFDSDYLMIQKELQHVSESVYKKKLDLSNGCPTPVSDYLLRFIKWRFLKVCDKDGIPLLRLTVEDMPAVNCLPVLKDHMTAVKDGVNRDTINNKGKLISGIYIDDRYLPKILKVWPGLNRVWRDIKVQSIEDAKRTFDKLGFIAP